MSRIVASRLVLLVVGLSLATPSGAGGQASLEHAVGQAAEAWRLHRPRELVLGSDTIRLRIPDVAGSAALRPSQAARLLEDYLGEADELAFELRGIRSAGADHAYAEFARRFQVRGTDEVREETVFLGFRLLDGAWRVREVRIAR
jgi:hypothetical protein